jgi:hypothetical protein
MRGCVRERERERVRESGRGGSAYCQGVDEEPNEGDPDKSGPRLN